MTEIDAAGSPAFAAAFVIGLDGPVTRADVAVAAQRLERAVRPWDAVVEVDAQALGVLCTSLTSAREIDAVALRLADVVRAPMAVGDDIRVLGVCIGSAAVAPGERLAAALDRAVGAMARMRAARAGLLAPDLPGPRGTGSVTLSG